MNNEILKYLETNLTVVTDVTKLSDEAYAIIRKDSLGASDASIVLGVNLYKNKEQLITEKKNKFLTDEEKEVSKKPAVKKGKDLESLNLQKFSELTGIKVFKPPYMYRHKEYSYLTTNFDGVGKEEFIIPVEAKVVTKYGEKYYKKHMPVDKTICILRDRSMDIIEHIKMWSAVCGIPPYYYTQVQQQILFLDSEKQTTPYGYLSCIFDDSWDFEYYYIPRDEFVISHIISDGAKLWERIEK
jgi:hypothetical protein